MDKSQKERARESALARAKTPHKGGRLSGQQGTTQNQGNQLTFFTEDASSWKLGPTTIMLLCLIYIGIVVTLHIFSKLRGGKTAAATSGQDL